MRKIVFVYLSESTGTTLRKVGNFLAKNAPLKIIVDGKQVAEMIDHQNTVVELSAAEHSVCMANSGIPSVVALNAKASGFAVKIPAGQESYMAFVQKEGNTYYLRVGYLSDSFLDGLQAYFKKLCAGKALQERISLKENRNDCVYLVFRDDGFRLEWDLANPEGLPAVVHRARRRNDLVRPARPAAAPGAARRVLGFHLHHDIGGHHRVGQFRMLAERQDHRKEAAQPDLMRPAANGKCGFALGTAGKKRGFDMGEYNTCSKCAYWVHGVCQATKERKNDTVCTCGMFKKREENK